MLRLLIGTGLLLMAVGFGAAGWQYWQGLPDRPALEAAPAPEAGPALPTQNWLISATGGLVPRADVRAFLVQDRLVPDRIATVVLTAPLQALLDEGEALPAAAYLTVFADIRAAILARPLCPVLTAGRAAACAVDAARLVEGSLDPVRGTARFRVDLAFRLRPAAEGLPDLAAHVLRVDLLRPDQAGGTAPPASPEAALAAALAATDSHCSSADRAPACRPLRLTVDWAPDAPLDFRAEIGWLAPLPEGMFPAPPLDLVPEG